MPSRFVAALAIAIAFTTFPAMADDGAAQALATLIAEYEAFQRQEDPVSAGLEGDQDALARLPDVSLDGDKRREAALQGFQTRLAGMEEGQPAGEDALNRSLLSYVLSDALIDNAFDTSRIPILNDSGFHTFQDYLARATRLRTMEDVDAYMARLSLLQKFWDDNLANLRRGSESGWAQPKIVVDRVVGTIERQLAIAPQDDVLVLPFRSADPSIDPATLDAMRDQAVLIIKEQVRPRQQEALDYLKYEYKVRPGLGVKDMPNGADYYRSQVRHHTTTDLDPDAIHELGLKEVARIRDLMQDVMVEAGFTGTFGEFLTFLRTDPQFYASSREQLLEKASEIAKRADDRLPALFGTLPRLPYGVRPVPAEQEEGYTTGRYFPGSPDLGIAGGYLVNTSHLDQRSLYELPALTLHEAVPGHHIQIALAQELKALPFFRRNMNVTAFTEGWGLYAEYLGEEMGMYRTPYEKFGRLSYEMWRACRLVADTGIHWKGWDIEQARSCFTDNSALSPHNIQTELERYIAWPGQALAYKIGEMKLKELRSLASDRLGAQFEVGAFHDRVLLAGPMPLAVLQARIEAWLADEQANRP